MDKQTLSNYGWIVICTLVLAVMLALATPFGGFIAGAFKATYAGFGNVTDNALAVIGIGNGGNGGSGEQGGAGETPTNGKLGAPSYVGYTTEDDIAYTLFIMGADANTEGYYVYIYDELVATIGANETYTFPGTASSEAVPIKVIAFANGYEDADAVTGVCMYGAAGVGCEMYHYVPNVSLNGTTLTIASTNEGAGGIMADCFDIYVDGTKVLQRQSAEPEGKDFDLSAYLTGDAHEIVVETSYCEAGCKLRAYYTGDWPSVSINYEKQAEPIRYVTTNFNFKDKEGRILDPDLKILIKYNGNVVCEFTTLGTEDFYNLTVPAEYECDIELYNGSTLLDSVSACMYVGELEGTGNIVDNDSYMTYSFNNFENTIITCEIYSQHESLANMGLTECYKCGKAF